VVLVELDVVDVLVLVEVVVLVEDDVVLVDVLVEVVVLVLDDVVLVVVVVDVEVDVDVSSQTPPSQTSQVQCWLMCYLPRLIHLLRCYW
jgi:hypothetical protein